MGILVMNDFACVGQDDVVLLNRVVQGWKVLKLSHSRLRDLEGHYACDCCLQMLAAQFLVSIVYERSEGLFCSMWLWLAGGGGYAWICIVYE